MMNQNLPNGIPSQFGNMQHVPLQDKSMAPLNGLDSSHSSRDSSPGRFHQIPTSQLPPPRPGIPTSQLPPSRPQNANINQLAQEYSRLSALDVSAKEVTPFSSPKMQTFSTSTPVLGQIKNVASADQSNLKFSVSNSNNQSGFTPANANVLVAENRPPVMADSKRSSPQTQSTFSHSATSQFTNVARPSRASPGENDSNRRETLTESIINKNTPASQFGENVDVRLDAKQSMEQNRGPDSTGNLQSGTQQVKEPDSGSKPFDMNTFAKQASTQQNLSQMPVATMSQQNQPNNMYRPVGSAQQNLQPSLSQPISSQHNAPIRMSQTSTNQYMHTGQLPLRTNQLHQNMPVKSNPQQSAPNINSNLQSSYKQAVPSTGPQQVYSMPVTSTSNFQQQPLQPTPQSQRFNKFQFQQQSVPTSSQGMHQSIFPHNPQSQVNAANIPSNSHGIPSQNPQQHITAPSLPPSSQGMHQNTFSQNPQSQPSLLNQAIQTNLNQANRPKIQSSSSQPRLNTYSGPQTQFSQPNQLPPNPVLSNFSASSQNFGSMPNLMPKQMPPNTSNLPMPPQPNQGAQSDMPNASPSASQFRPSMHMNRYPMQQPPPGTSSVTQQSYQSSPVYSNQQQSLNQGNFQRQPNTYENQPVQNQYQNYSQNLSVTQAGFNKLWGMDNYDLLQSPNILSQEKLEPPKISLGQDFLDAVNCSPEIFRCTMTKIPETSSLLQKSRLPLGVLIHPFRDLNHLAVIQCNTIVRCRACRTYINPYVFFVDSKRWKCNLCYRINELPEEFQFDPVSKSYGDPTRRPEVKSSTIEYIAPAEYMLRPPQPAVYLYLLDVSRLAVETGYLHTVCSVLSAELANLPGDARTHIGFLAYDSALHFYSLSEGLSQPHEMTVLDIDDVFLPCPDNLLVNLQDRMELVSDLLAQLPSRYTHNYDTGSALGAALQVAYKMMAGTGGRVTVFQAVLPTVGPGSLVPREDPSQRASSETPHLNPANDFYKRLALECSGQQIAVDLFILNSQYVDLATISGISKFSGGCIHHIPLFKDSRTVQNESLERCFRRYVTRKIGFEAVMRIRCTRGMSIHTFHGNFFVRSTDLLSLPNINPDAGFGMQVAIEENLSDVQTVCFQAALLYTSSKGERRIRVHTLCLPVANTLTDIINSADQQCIIGLLSKMAVDRSMHSSLSDAREAFLNVAIDILSSYKLSLNMGAGQSGLMAPHCLKLLPLYISALLKSAAFRIGTSTRLDDRVKAMCDMKTKPLPYLIQQIYPDLYPVHNLEEQRTIVNEEEELVHLPPHLQLTSRNLDSHGAYLLDTGDHMVLFVCSSVSLVFLNQALGVADFSAISEEMYELPLLENPYNQRLQTFISYLNEDKPFAATLQIIRENSCNRSILLERLIEDRLENSLSYHEFLQHIKTQVK